jgi:O-antigen/teichoic acid export membrane protein
MNKFWVDVLPSFLRQKLEGRQYLQNVVGNTGWLFADKVVRMGVGLLVGIWVARYLGPSQFGLFSFALAFVALFSAFSSMGLDDIVVRNIVRDLSVKEETLGSAFILRFFGSVAAFLVAVGAIVLLRPNDNLVQCLVMIMAAGMTFQAFDVIDLWYQSRIQSKYSVYAKLSSYLLIAVVKISLILAKAPLVAFAWAGFAEVVAGSLGLFTVYRMNGYRLKAWRISVTRMNALLKDCWPLILSGIAGTIYLRIDQVMIGELAGIEEVGIYSAAVRLAEAWYFVPMIIYFSVLPSIVEAKTLNEDLFYSRLQKFYNMMALLGYGVALPVTFLSGWIVKVLFGVAYNNAGPMLSVLIWAGIFVNLGVARSSFLISMNLTKFHFFTVLFGALVNIGLNYWLIPIYGGMGAVIASCVSYWVAVHGACFFYKPLRKTGRMITKAMFFPKVW